MSYMEEGLLMGIAQGARANARDWQAYARRLEAELANTQANKAGMVALKDAALAELARVDPNNYLMAQQNRQRIFDAAYNPATGGKRTS